jgi:hypothetical protein
MIRLAVLGGMGAIGHHSTQTVGSLMQGGYFDRNGPTQKAKDYVHAHETHGFGQYAAGIPPAGVTHRAGGRSAGLAAELPTQKTHRSSMPAPKTKAPSGLTGPPGSEPYAAGEPKKPTNKVSIQVAPHGMRQVMNVRFEPHPPEHVLHEVSNLADRHPTETEHIPHAGGSTMRMFSDKFRPGHENLVKQAVHRAGWQRFNEAFPDKESADEVFGVAHPDSPYFRKRYACKCDYAGGPSSLDVPSSEHNRAIHAAIKAHPPGHEFALGELRHHATKFGDFGKTEMERQKNFNRELSRMVDAKEIHWTPRGGYKGIQSRAPYEDLAEQEKPPAIQSLPGQKTMFPGIKQKNPPLGVTRKPPKSLFSRLYAAYSRIRGGGLVERYADKRMTRPMARAAGFLDLAHGAYRAAEHAHGAFGGFHETPQSKAAWDATKAAHTLSHTLHTESWRGKRPTHEQAAQAHDKAATLHSAAAKDFVQAGYPHFEMPYHGAAELHTKAANAHREAGAAPRPQVAPR